MDNATTDRPWLPAQVFGTSFLFGPLAGGAITGINFKRLNRPQYLLPCLIVGFILFLLEASALMFFVPAEASQPVGLVANLAIGFGFMWTQKSTFEAWKAANWTPVKEGERYKPNRIGFLFLVGLGCLAVEMGIIFLIVLLQAK